MSNQPSSVSLICNCCDQPFLMPGFRYNRRMTKGFAFSYCSRTCYAKVATEKLKQKPLRLGTGDPNGAEKQKENRRRWDRQNRIKKIEAGICTECKKPAAPNRLQCKEHAHAKNQQTQKDNRKIKMEILAAYGSICQCCGEHRTELLTIDHINNDGTSHRRQLFGPKKQIGGARFYRVLKKQGFPPGFQILCFNCNISKGFCGYCPHSREIKEPFAFCG